MSVRTRATSLSRATGSKCMSRDSLRRPLPGEGTRIVQTPAGVGGEIAVVDGTTMQLQEIITLRHSDKPDFEMQGRGIPNYLGAVAISPDGQSAWVPSKQDNIKRGSQRDGHGLTLSEHDPSDQLEASTLRQTPRTMRRVSIMTIPALRAPSSMIGSASTCSSLSRPAAKLRSWTHTAAGRCSDSTSVARPRVSRFRLTAARYTSTISWTGLSASSTCLACWTRVSPTCRSSRPCPQSAMKS